jgi:tyrosyl-tRNA synthetase
MSILDELEQRGLLHDVTNREELGKLLAAGCVPVYAGYDPTSATLHIGNLVPTILLKRFQLAGHRPIVLVGGATGMVGDPSGKSEERNLLDDATLARNVAGIRDQLSKLLDFDDPTTGALLVNNADWTRGISYLEFLRDVGKHLTINYMMAKDSVKSRITRTGDADVEGISYTEFSYMLLQAYDFVHLAGAAGCRLQVGGSDQWGNITAGIELGRRMRNIGLFGLVAPLLLDSSGVKMGKTASGERVDLSAAVFSPYRFYQYWFNQTDADVVPMLKRFSLRPLAELDAVLAEHDRDRSKRVAQRELARTMTSWVHGDAEVARSEAAAKVMFGGTLEGLTDADLGALVGVVPTFDVSRAELSNGVSLVDLIARSFDESKGTTRKLIEQGAAYVNNVKVSDSARVVTLGDLATETMLVLASGKKNRRLVRVI